MDAHGRNIRDIISIDHKDFSKGQSLIPVPKFCGQGSLKSLDWCKEEGMH
jgi:hypothetical protein